MKLTNIPKIAVDFINGYNDSIMHPKQRLPRVIQFPINDICNSKCQMCNIWQQKRDYEVTPEKIRYILSNNLYRKVKAVGINGGEPTLRKDIREVTEAVTSTLPNLNSISLITNAIIEKKVIDAIKTMSEVCNQNNIHLGVMVSLDGVGDVHDNVRGRKGNFESAVKVLEFLKNSPHIVSNYKIGCTIIKENVFGVEDLLHWCIDNDIYARFRLGVPHQRLYSDDYRTAFDLSYEEKFHIANFLDYLRKHYENDESRRFFYKSLRDQIIYKKPRAAGCDWKSRGVTLTSKGELLYCAVQSKILGDAKEEKSNNLYWKNSDHLKEIVQNKCATCHHDYEGFSDRKLFVKNFAKEVIQKLPDYASIISHNSIIKYKNFDHFTKTKKLLDWSKNIIIEQKDLVPNQVLICGWYGTETLGDKAILGGIINKIKEFNNNTIVHLASLEPYVSEMTSFQMNELGINKILDIQSAKEKVINGYYEKVIMGGGPLMSSVSEVTQMLELFTHSKKVGAENIIWGCGIGPLFEGHINNQVIKQLLAISNKIYVRDSGSQKLLTNELEIDKYSNVAIDPAFEWIMNNKSSNTERKSKQIILALRDWPLKEYASDIDKKKALNIKESFEEQIQRFISALLKNNQGFKIIPFCMHKYATGGDDRFFYKKLLKNFPEVLENLDMQHRTPLCDLKLFQESSFVLAMRYHSTVFSIATKTPFISIDYTRGGKITGLLQDVSLDDRLIEIDKFDGNSIAKNFELLSQQTFDMDNLVKEKLANYNQLFIS